MFRKAVSFRVLPGVQPCQDYCFGLLVADFLDCLLGWTPMLLLPLRLLGRFVAVPVGGGGVT